MRTNWRFAIAFTAILACAAAMASAQPVERHIMGPGGCGQALANAVGLTAAQQSALDTLRQQTADAIKPIAEQAGTVYQQIETAVSGVSPDACAIGALLIQVHSLHSQIQTLQKNAEASFVASLTADQQAKYATFVAAHPGCTFLHAGPPGLERRIWIGPPGIDAMDGVEKGGLP